MISSSGLLNQPVVLPKCKAQLLAYSNPKTGPYWKELSLAAAQAIETLHLADVCKAAPAEFPASMELSTKQTFQNRTSSSSSTIRSKPDMLPPPSKDQLIVFDIDETVLSNLAYLSNPNSTLDKWIDTADSTPIHATRCLYLSLQAAGYSVAFVTGRGEKQRTPTLLNLKRGGFGKPCLGNGSIPSLPSSSKSEAGPSNSSNKASSKAEPQCFVALFMRSDGGKSLASVYKPRARRQMLDMLHRSGSSNSNRGISKVTLLALVGDQFSDMNGEHAAPYAFKLPNPFYYVL